jgi:hypothetical protein
VSDSCVAAGENKVDWNIASKAIGIIFGVILSIYQLREIISRTRSTIKIDLEILKLLDPSDPNYIAIKSKIDENIRRTYGIKQSRSSNFPSGEYLVIFILGVFLTLFFAALTFYLVKDGFTWWALLTLYFMWKGIVLLSRAFDRPPPK